MVRGLPRPGIAILDHDSSHMMRQVESSATAFKPLASLVARTATVQTRSLGILLSVPAMLLRHMVMWECWQ